MDCVEEIDCVRDEDKGDWSANIVKWDEGWSPSFVEIIALKYQRGCTNPAQIKQ